MNLAGIKEAVIARVQADTGSGGLWASAAKLINSITYGFEGRVDVTGIRGAQPYVSFDFPAIEESDGYTHELQEFHLRFHVWYHFLRNKDAAITAAANIVDRLYGDATTQATRNTPTYGFHRHTLVLTTVGDAGAPWATGKMWKTSSNESHEREALHFIETYRVNMSRTRTAGYTG